MSKSFRTRENKGKIDWIRPKSWIIFFLLFSLSTLMTFKNVSPEQRLDLKPPLAAVPTSLFGMHIHRAATKTPWPTVLFATWRLWDAYVAWANLEPRKGEWHFETLDKYVALAEKHNVEILLPLALSPTWASARPAEPSAYSPGFAAEPKDLEDWRNYVRKVATRYKGRIRYYQSWNEPNLQRFYSGTVEQMVALSRDAYLILKEVDPSITVVSPSATGDRRSAPGDSSGPSWLEEYFSRGGGTYADVIGYHFYVGRNPPEAIVPLIKKVQRIMAKYGIGNKPLWNTEAGWAIANSRNSGDSKRGVLTTDKAAAYVARSFILAWAAGLERFYWYAWDNRLRGLTEKDGKTVKLPGTAYAETQKWLVGARMTDCESNSEKTWTCQLKRNHGYTAWIMWNPDRKLTFNVPKNWGVRQLRDLTGLRRNLPTISRIQIGPSPLLLERSAL